MNLPRRSKFAIPVNHPEQAKPVPIVSDGLVGTAAVDDGRTVPVIVIDTSSRRDIDRLVLAHKKLGPGDVVSGWPITRSWLAERSIRLILRFVRPSSCTVILEFDVEQQGVLVDQVLYAKGLWLQPGRHGDRPGTLLDKPKLLVEVPPNQEFRRVWEPMFEKAMIRRFRKQGLSRPIAKRCGKKLINEWRELFHDRMPVSLGLSRPDGDDPE